MNSLPDELQLLILSFLDPHDWRATKYANYRLVSRRYASIGAQKMFENFQFRPTTVALDDMKSIAGSNLRKIVSTLDYKGEQDDTSKDEILKTTVFRDVAITFSQAGSPVTALAAQHLDPSILHPQGLTTEFLDACTNLTTLDLYFAYDTSFDVSSLYKLVQVPQKLEMLCLCIGEDKNWHGIWSRPPSLKNVVPLHPKWARLHSIHLQYMTTTELDLTTLLKHLPRTLRCFHFEGFKLVREGGLDRYETPESCAKWQPSVWQRVFAQLSKMGELRHGTLSTLEKNSHQDTAVWKVTMESDGRDVEIQTNLVKWLHGGDEPEEDN